MEGGLGFSLPFGRFLFSTTLSFSPSGAEHPFSKLSLFFVHHDPVEAVFSSPYRKLKALFNPDLLDPLIFVLKRDDGGLVMLRLPAPIASFLLSLVFPDITQSGFYFHHLLLFFLRLFMLVF
jgi:hypothetical protein